MNHYEVLGVPQNASQSQIRNAYISQVKLFHPDVFLGDPSIAKVKTWQLNEAYYVLHDPARRAEYDRRFFASKNPPPSYSDTSIFTGSSKQSTHSKDAKKKTINSFLILPIATFAISVIYCFVLIFTLNENPENNRYSDSYYSKQTDDTIVSSSEKSPDSISDYPSEYELIPAPVPENGQVLYSNDLDRVAPLSVVTRGNNNFCVKLKSIGGTTDILTFFVRAGETVEIDVPLGKYTLYYATGETWYGESILFGESTLYYKADDVFDFYEADGFVNGWTIELYAQVNGNLSTESIDSSEF